MRCYARNGDEITFEQYAQLLGDDEYRTVEQTQVGPYWVSTVWLGLDHNFWGGGPPIIFETMVFVVQRDDPELATLGPELDGRRYATEDEARAGHAEMILLIQATHQEVPTNVEESQ